MLGSRETAAPKEQFVTFFRTAVIIRQGCTPCASNPIALRPPRAGDGNQRLGFEPSGLGLCEPVSNGPNALAGKPSIRSAK